MGVCVRAIGRGAIILDSDFRLERAWLSRALCAQRAAVVFNRCTVFFEKSLDRGWGYLTRPSGGGGNVASYVTGVAGVAQLRELSRRHRRGNVGVASTTYPGSRGKDSDRGCRKRSCSVESTRRGACLRLWSARSGCVFRPQWSSRGCAGDISLRFAHVYACGHSQCACVCSRFMARYSSDAALGAQMRPSVLQDDWKSGTHTHGCMHVMSAGSTSGTRARPREAPASVVQRICPAEETHRFAIPPSVFFVYLWRVLGMAVCLARFMDLVGRGILYRKADG